jgi:hypothetical protein
LHIFVNFADFHLIEIFAILAFSWLKILPSRTSVVIFKEHFLLNLTNRIPPKVQIILQNSLHWTDIPPTHIFQFFCD